MAKAYTCDVCKKPTDRIVAKIQYIPAGGGKRITHSDYTHHADVGECCAEKLLRLFNFRPRMTRKDYLASRRA